MKLCNNFDINAPPNIEHKNKSTNQAHLCKLIETFLKKWNSKQMELSNTLIA